MKDWETSRIICLGLVIMGVVSTIGYYVCMMMGMSPTIEPTISIVTGLFGAIGVVTGNKKHDDTTMPSKEGSIREEMKDNANK